MAVTFDAVGPSSAGQGSTGSTTLTWTHTAVAAGVTLLAGVELDNTSDSGITMTCKCDGVAMTSLGTKESDSQTAGYLQAWSITGISSGAHTILVTASASVTDLAGGSISFAGAGAPGTPVTASGTTGSAPSVAVASTAASSLVAGFVASGDSITATTSPATSRFLDNLQAGAGHATGNAAGATSAGGGTVTMAWTLNAGAVPWAAIAVEVPFSGVSAVAGLASGAGAGLAPGTIPASAADGPNFPALAAALSGGSGTWQSPVLAEGPF